MIDHNVPLGILMRPPYPMLAKTGKAADVPGAIERGYLIEPKVDGIRCMAVVSPEIIQLYNRQLVNVTRRFPEIVDRLRLVCSSGTRMLGNLILDGEVFVRGTEGQADFQLVQHRANRLHDIGVAVAEYPADYVAFDVLSSGKLEYMRMSLAQRRAVLSEVAGPLMVASYTQDEADRAIRDQEGEGLMLKHVSSRYVPGARSPSWLKIKHETEVTCWVGGVTYGIGKREPYFGSLLLGTRLPGDAHGTGRLTYIGTVGTGFTDASLENLTLHLSQLRTADNPFSTRGTDWDLAYFVRPVLSVRVRFTNWTKDRVLRFPRFVGLAE